MITVEQIISKAVRLLRLALIVVVSRGVVKSNKYVLNYIIYPIPQQVNLLLRGLLSFNKEFIKLSFLGLVAALLLEKCV